MPPPHRLGCLPPVVPPGPDPLATNTTGLLDDKVAQVVRSEDKLVLGQ